ncbi:MAG: hypothetical protein GY826_20945, partial [Fuerstiella sp.]|nr:hypothetical protein [Fuerstiella sp.]
REIEPPAPNAAQAFFSKKILPVFRAKCLDCHGEDQQEGSLRLDSLVHVMRGGNSGEPVLIVGDDVKSHLIQLVTTKDAQRRMPLDDEPLNAEEIHLLRGWISIETGWEAAIAEAATIKSDHWSFQPVQRPEVPKTNHANPNGTLLLLGPAPKLNTCSPLQQKSPSYLNENSPGWCTWFQYL